MEESIKVVVPHGRIGNLRFTVETVKSLRYKISDYSNQMLQSLSLNIFYFVPNQEKYIETITYLNNGSHAKTHNVRHYTHTLKLSAIYIMTEYITFGERRFLISP